MIFSSVLAALGQLKDPRFLRVLALGVGLTIALLVGVYVVFALAVGWLLPDTLTLPWIGEITWVGAALTWAGVPVMLVLSVFLMVPVSTLFMGMFLERVADAVEDAHYPGLPAARPIGPLEGLWDALRFLGVMLAVNAVALIAYLLFLPLAPILFWVVNGLLIGREYGQLVALRRSDATGAAAFRKKNRLTLFAAGVVMVIPLSVPVLNLLVPILGAATFTHLYHRLMLTPRAQTA